jgi:hypothetical protein
MPPSLAKYLEAVRSLDFYQKPNYTQFDKYLRSALDEYERGAFPHPGRFPHKPEHERRMRGREIVQMESTSIEGITNLDGQHDDQL